MVAARLAWVPGARRAAACLAASALLVAAGAQTSAMAATDSERRARIGVGYLASQQEADGSIPAFSAVGSTADAVISMVAARRGADTIVDAMRYLRMQVAKGAVTNVGQRAQVSLAVVAAGGTPREFGGRNLIAQLRATEQPNGRYGRSTDVYEHALAMLALAAADAGPSTAATAWLARAQCGDGGWQNDDPPGPTRTSTASTESIRVGLLHLRHEHHRRRGSGARGRSRISRSGPRPVRLLRRHPGSEVRRLGLHLGIRDDRRQLRRSSWRPMRPRAGGCRAARWRP